MGDTTGSIEVSGSIGLVGTVGATFRETVDGKRMTERPLTGRNPLKLGAGRRRKGERPRTSGGRVEWTTRYYRGERGLTPGEGGGFGEDGFFEAGEGVFADEGGVEPDDDAAEVLGAGVFDLGDEGFRGGVGGVDAGDEAAGVRSDGAELGGEIAFERRQVGAVDLGDDEVERPFTHPGGPVLGEVGERVRVDNGGVRDQGAPVGVLETTVEGVHELIEAGGAPGEPGGAGGVVRRGLAVVFAAVEFDGVFVVAAVGLGVTGAIELEAGDVVLFDDLGHEFKEEVLDLGVGMDEEVEVLPGGAGDGEAVVAGAGAGEPVGMGVKDGAAATGAGEVVAVAADKAVLGPGEDGDAGFAALFEEFGEGVAPGEVGIDAEAGFAFEDVAGPEGVAAGPDVDEGGVAVGGGEGLHHVADGLAGFEGGAVDPDGAEFGGGEGGGGEEGEEEGEEEHWF